MAEAQTQQPIALRAKRDFWIAFKKDGQQLFSFDGKTLVDPNDSRYGLLVDAGDHGPAVGLLMFIGSQEDLPEQLR